MNADVAACFARLAAEHAHEMASTAEPEETTQRYHMKRDALAVELWLKGYDVEGYDDEDA